MNINTINNAHFIGIGGIGMSNLARYFLSKNIVVSGYDRTETAITKALIVEGASIHYADQLDELNYLSSIDLVVYTPAIPSNNAQLSFFRDSAVKIMKRAEVLGLITKQSYCIAVAGTHGKTTTSSIVAHMLEYSKIGCTAFLGGIATNFNSNFILNKGSENVVVEADEYDRSFLNLTPDIVILTSIDPDHLDIYGSAENVQQCFQEFVNLIPKTGKLISNYGLSIESNLKKTYGENGAADFKIFNTRVEDGEHYFDLAYGAEIFDNISLGLPGKHNIYNAAAVFALGIELGIDHQVIVKSFSSFKGVKRRFEYHIKTPTLIFIDDYAHHPQEIEATISSVKELFPDKKLTVVFQPHLFSRTNDFMEEFADSLSAIDEVILLDIYPARELPIKGVSSSVLLEKINCNNKLLLQEKEVVTALKDRYLEVVLTLGAGDIDQLVSPIKNMLTAKLEIN